MDVKDEIKEKLSIVDVVSQYVSLKPSGQNYTGLSPFTTEKTPSFHVSPERGLYYCFSTSQGGDIFTFVEKMEGLDFRGALKVLAEKAGVSLRPEDRKKWEERDVLFAIMEEATLFFQNKFASTIPAKDYLAKRGLRPEIIASFRLGFSPAGWRDLKDYLIQKGFSENHIEKAGLVKHTEKGSYDRFRSRIMFPIADSSGRIIAFSGRIFFEDETTATEDQKNAAKYLNSPDTPLFNKSDIFFGLDKAKSAIKKNNFAILVEGQMDLLMLHQIGYTNTIAASGTALTDKTTTREGLLSHMGLVQRLTNNLVLAYDGDKAGLNASKRAVSIALHLGIDTKVIQMPSGVDPADFVKDQGKEAWSGLLRNAVSIVEMLTKKITIEETDLLRIGRRIRNEVLQEIKEIPSAIEQDNYLHFVSKLTEIPYKALQKDFSQLDDKELLSPPEIENTKTRQVKKFPDKITKTLGLVWYLEDREDFEHSTILLSFVQRFSGTLYKDWVETLQDKKQELIFESEIELGSEGEIHALSIKKKIEDSALDILRYLRPEYNRSIGRLEKIKDDQKMQKVMSDFHHIIIMIESPDELKQELYGNKKENNN